jgi:hypothetical protein
MARLFDDFVGEAEQQGRHGRADRPRGLTSSNLVACITSMSAGFSLLGMHPA